MKVFIALALVSVALATPVIQPVQLPEAPRPAVEAMAYIPMYEPVDIRPAFVPVDVLEALKLQAVPAEILAAVAHVDAAFKALNEIPAEPVKVVDVAEELAALSAEEIPAEAVKVVDIAEIIEDVAAVPADAVKVVEVAENIEAAEELAPLSDAEIPAEPVNVVDHAETVEAAEEIPAEPVNVVEVAENIEAAVADSKAESVAEDTVRVVEAPVRYPGKVFDNSMLR